MRHTRLVTRALGLLAAFALLATAGSAHAGGPAGSVYVLGNSPAGNAVLAYTRAADGSLSGPSRTRPAAPAPAEASARKGP